MPKRSREETKITITTISDAVLDQLIRLGYDRMSYTTLSKQTGISRTGISHHFPKKHDFILELDQQIYEVLTAHLVLDKCLEDFSRSWLDSLSRPEFIGILKVLFHHIVTNGKEKKMEQLRVNSLYRELIGKFGETSESELDRLIGRSLLEMSVKP